MPSWSKSKLASRLRDGLTRIGFGLHGGVKPELEVVYQNIFDRDLASLSIPNTFYPLNAAANYSLLYLILRSARELEIRSIVELGAGQSSLLIDTLRKRGLVNGQALTIEHDAEWAAHIGRSVDHPVARAPLVPRSDGTRTYQGYDLSAVSLPDKIDFLLIDGPLGWGPGRTFARHGALPLLERLDPDGFIVIVDDAEREGERALTSRIHSRLAEKGIVFRSNPVFAAKRQDVFASGRMKAAVFY